MSEIARRRGSLPRLLTHKGAMVKLVEHLQKQKLPVPRINLTLKDKGYHFWLALIEQVVKWDTAEMAAFFHECTGHHMPRYKTWEQHVHDVKLLIADIFYIDDYDTMKIPPDAIKMWPGGFTHSKEEMKTMKVKKTEASKEEAGTETPKKVSKFGGAAKKKATRQSSIEKASTPKPAKPAKPAKKSGGKQGQFAPLGTTAWGKVPDTLKVVPREGPSGPPKRVGAYELVPKGGITVGKWVESVTKKFKVKETRARSLIWPLLNRHHVKKAA